MPADWCIQYQPTRGHFLEQLSTELNGSPVQDKTRTSVEIPLTGSPELKEPPGPNPLKASTDQTSIKLLAERYTRIDSF